MGYVLVEIPWGVPWYRYKIIPYQTSFVGSVRLPYLYPIVL